MITQKKTVEEFIYEFMMAVLTNSPFPDFEEFIDTDIDGPTGDSTVGLRGELIPKFGRISTKYAVRMYVSPSFPNNVILPDDLQGYADKTSYQCYFGLHVRELQNQVGIIINREIKRKFIYVLPTKAQTENEDFAETVFNTIKDLIDANNDYPQNLFGYPVLYTLEVPEKKNSGGGGGDLELDPFPL